MTQLTKREQIAAMAMQGMLAYCGDEAAGSWHNNATPKHIAINAYQYADAMLAQSDEQSDEQGEVQNEFMERDNPNAIDWTKVKTWAAVHVYSGSFKPGLQSYEGVGYYIGPLPYPNDDICSQAAVQMTDGRILYPPFQLMTRAPEHDVEVSK